MACSCQGSKAGEKWVASTPKGTFSYNTEAEAQAKVQRTGGSYSKVSGS